MMLRFHTQTAGSTLTARQPMLNIPRVTLQALAAVLGGTQSLHTNSFDEALALPTEQSASIALRTQQIIGFESGAADTADPLGGSYFVEALTDRIEEGVYLYLENIQRMGGALRAIESGFYIHEISKAAYDYQKKVESEEVKVVGVNCFKSDEIPIENTLHVDDSLRAKEIMKLQKLFASRDNSRCEETLRELKNAANGKENMMYPILECVRASVTIGEICDALRQVWGEYRGGTG